MNIILKNKKIRIIGLLLSTVIACSAGARAAVVSGAFHEYVAGEDVDADTTWEDTGTAANRNFSFSDVSRISLSGHGYNFTHAYSFPGTGDGEAGSGGQEMTATGLRNGNNKSSFELWFRVAQADLPPVDQDHMVLFETGGGAAGLSFNLFNNGGTQQVRFVSVKIGTTSVALSYDLQAADYGTFLQLSATVDPGVGTTFYVKGSSVDTNFFSSSTSTWIDGADDAGIGMSSSASGIPSTKSVNANIAFKGEVAILRHYDDTVLSSTQIQQNFDAMVVVPEPATLMLILTGFGLILLFRLLRPTS